MEKQIVLLGLDALQTDQRAGIARNRIDDAAHGAVESLQLEFLAEPRAGHHAAHIAPFGGVDHDRTNAGLDDFADLLVAREQKAVAHKRMRHPVATEVMDVHAQCQLRGIDFL
jgi:hypothetical protein